MLKIIYKPFGIVVGILAGMLGKTVFTQVWQRLDDADPPGPTDDRISWPKFLFAAAMQGVILRVVRVLVDRGFARTVQYLTGYWPGQREPDAAS